MYIFPFRKKKFIQEIHFFWTKMQSFKCECCCEKQGKALNCSYDQFECLSSDFLMITL